MAVYETSLSGRRGVVSSTGWGREKIILPAIVAMTTAMLNNADDDVGLFYAPKGLVVTGATLRCTDMDGATALVIDVGIPGTEELFIANSTVGQAGGVTSVLAVAGFMYKFEAKTQVRAYISTAAGTPLAGTLYFALEGFVDPDFNTTALTAA
jgi:hypothetical protein